MRPMKGKYIKHFNQFKNYIYTAIMKKLLQNSFLLLLPFLAINAAIAQDYPDPNVDAATVSPSPIPPGQPKDISVSFHLINDAIVEAAPQARSRITVSLGQLDIDDDFDPVTDITSSSGVQYYTWTYDQAIKMFTGVLTTTMPGKAETVITFKNLVSIGTSTPAMPKNGLNVNVVAPTAYDATKGAADNTSAFTSSESNISAPLPLDLISFTGTAVGCTAKLTWKTANEINNSYFEIQRSLDGIHYSPIGQVAASNSISENNYTFSTLMSSEAKNSFRLKMMDKAGKFTTSHVVTLSCSKTAQISAAPNPVTAQLKISGLSEGKYTISLFDINGLQLKRLSVQGVTSKVIQMGQYAAGIYFIKLSDDHGVTSTLRIIKK